jgi:excisionase family DNA binding protein
MPRILHPEVEAMPDQGDVMTLQEVAEYLKVGAKTIYSLVQRGRIPGFKVGGQWRFRRKDIEQWVESQMHRITRRRKQ